MDVSIPRDELADQLLILEGGLHRFLAEQAREHDLSLAQLRTLLRLYITGDFNMGEIAAVNALSLPATTVLVDNLVKSGYVKRNLNEANRRQVRIDLTQEGEELAAACHANWRSLADSLITPTMAPNEPAQLPGVAGLLRILA